MLNNLSDRQKQLLFITGALLLLVVMYRFAIANTLEQRRIYQQNIAIATQIADAPLQIKHYRNQLAQLDTSLQITPYDREYLFAQLNSFCREHNLLLLDFPPTVVEPSTEYIIITNTAKVRGNYQDIVKLIYFLEQQRQLTYVISTRMYQEQNLRTRETYLAAQLYLRNLQNLQ